MAQPREGHGGRGQRGPGDLTALLTLVNGEECGRCGSQDGIADVVTTGVDLRDHLQGADALWYRHGPLRLAAGKVGSVAWPGATSTPCLAQPHSQEGDAGTA